MNATLTPPIALVLLGPFLGCVWLSVGRTRLVSALSAALGLTLGLLEGPLASAGFAVQYGALLLGCALGPFAARRRTVLEAAVAEARELTRRTQHLILRPISHDLAGTRVCTRYHCAGAASDSGLASASGSGFGSASGFGSGIGGDLYDVAVTPYGLRVVVGDVRGHGTEVQRLTAATIAAFRELAYTAPDLPALVTDLDKRITPDLNAEDFVTAVVAEFASGEVRLVNCGHPAPLRAGRHVELLEPGTYVPPLGLHPDPRQYRFRLQPGERLLLYTDGLTEARSADGTPFPLLTEATDALRELLPDEALDSLYARVVAHTGSRPADDLTLVLCQPSEMPVAVPLAIRTGTS
ncbi:serine/threonine-protein phosphatase [Streptomyces sp. Act143]|uniref:PP2C family protein-serine/threonine phosphatase n=1 Tax=Streptomyces sp. Act143 TaxID=2200760 RepID=UPI000D677A34|nr:PP2C family protein-serine/threonine phosphatase [Streptomyces sp. Act143]PWI18699.1 serine/threonine-protein phosphatase [Streptomyces sp. Act143]